MSELLLDEISPRYVREKRLTLTLDPSITKPRANAAILVNVDYSRTRPEGIALPLILEVQGPSAGSYQRREFTRIAPDSIIFTPREGGLHQVTLREAAHNLWWAVLKIAVEGEFIEAPKSV